MFVTCGRVAVALERPSTAGEGIERSKSTRFEGKDALDDGGQDDRRGVGF